MRYTDHIKWLTASLPKVTSQNIFSDQCNIGNPKNDCNFPQYLIIGIKVTDPRFLPLQNFASANRKAELRNDYYYYCILKSNK